MSAKVLSEEEVMRKQILRARTTLVFSMLSIPAVWLFPQTAATNSRSTKSAAEAYHNVQVLKDIPADELIPSMQFITYSLGVECSYCHVEGALEKDDKKTKLTARKMMKMMLAINRENFDSRQVVTCNSCHRGVSRPVSIPMIADFGAEADLGTIP